MAVLERKFALALLLFLREVENPPERLLVGQVDPGGELALRSGAVVENQGIGGSGSPRQRQHSEDEPNDEAKAGPDREGLGLAHFSRFLTAAGSRSSEASACWTGTGCGAL